MIKMAKDEEEYGQAPVCNGCMNWDRFEKKCWVYWDLKKDCSHFADGSVIPGTPTDAIKAAIPKQMEAIEPEEEKKLEDKKI